ncbi:MAG: spondin domain-containing protein [Candidatus Polarisedimenticolaceae bacterium]|nr:spondin domain-containing protein [Candidatus Polarisedimenticolaceae bacterium]
MKKYIAGVLTVSSLILSGAASARDLKVEITNLTNGLYFTPLLVAAHIKESTLFELGMPASAALQAMAEGGDISGLVMQVESAGGIYAANPAAGLLAPGATTSANLALNHNRRYLSIAAMLLPTNDGFVGLGALKIPKKRGSYTYYLNAYDAGTEANDEVITGGGAPGVAGIPADPGALAGSGGSGVAGLDHNTTVHIHRGTMGDTDSMGGMSDLDSRHHRWTNPVARLVITIKEGRDDD